MNKKGIAVTILLLVTLIICVVLGSCQKETKEEQPEATLQDVRNVVQNVKTVIEPEAKTGEYTIFQYCQNGWTNHLYATAYYKKDGTTYAELRDYPGEFIPVDGQTLPIPKWIVDPNELMEYGFWEPAEVDW